MYVVIDLEVFETICSSDDGSDVITVCQLGIDSRVEITE